MDTTPAPSRATTLPNQTPKRARSSPSPCPADIDSSSPSTPSKSSPRDPGSANLSSFCAFLDQQTTPRSPSKSRHVSRPSPPRTRSQSVPNATILTTTKPVPITPSTTIISATKPYYHQTKDKSLWKLPALKKSTLIIGSSNLNRITKTSSDTEIHSYPGAQIHHIQSILESYDHDPKPTTIILHVGLNNRDQIPKTSFNQAQKLIATANKTFPNSKILFTCIPISNKISKKAQQNLSTLNNMMMESSINSATILPPYEEEFETVDNLHWSPETANSIYLFWIYQLQASSKSLN
uniref:SGNH hydrolase-type esterase domain-containing protein n=1 Tax=Amphimedon queenslandica TaxID=400682 RepID=A0A1X7SHU7_AMPQE